MEIAGTCRVTMHFDVSLDDGEVVQSTQGSAPMEFEYGRNMLLPGLEKRLEGMSAGDEKEIVVPPEEAYGMPNPDAQVKVPRSEVPVDGDLEIGMVFQMQSENGQVALARLVELNDNEITLDINHPLAGETLHFKVKIEKVEESKGMPDACGCGCGCETEPEDCGGGPGDCGCG